MLSSPKQLLYGAKRTAVVKTVMRATAGQVELVGDGRTKWTSGERPWTQTREGSDVIFEQAVTETGSAEIANAVTMDVEKMTMMLEMIATMAMVMMVVVVVQWR